LPPPTFSTLTLMKGIEMPKRGETDWSWETNWLFYLLGGFVALLIVLGASNPSTTTNDSTDNNKVVRDYVQSPEGQRTREWYNNLPGR